MTDKNVKILLTKTGTIIGEILEETSTSISIKNIAMLVQVEQGSQIIPLFDSIGIVNNEKVGTINKTELAYNELFTPQEAIVNAWVKTFDESALILPQEEILHG